VPKATLQSAKKASVGEGPLARCSARQCCLWQHLSCRGRRPAGPNSRLRREERCCRGAPLARSDKGNTACGVKRGVAAERLWRGATKATLPAAWPPAAWPPAAAKGFGAMAACGAFAAATEGTSGYSNAKIKD